VTQLSVAEYDELERAIIDGRRIAVFRRGTEYLVIPRALRMRDGDEVIEAIHPTTGEEIRFAISELSSVAVVKDRK